MLYGPCLCNVLLYKSLDFLSPPAGCLYKKKAEILFVPLRCSTSEDRGPNIALLRPPSWQDSALVVEGSHTGGTQSHDELTD
jgi:hypothetical protein